MWEIYPVVTNINISKPTDGSREWLDLKNSLSLIDGVLRRVIYNHYLLSIDCLSKNNCFFHNFSPF